MSPLDTTEKMKKLTQKELKKLKLEYTEHGFCLWGEDGRWILDGSCLMKDGHITFCNRDTKVQVIMEDSTFAHEHKCITLKKIIKN